MIGNHDALGDMVRAHGVPFHHVGVPAARRSGRRQGRGVRRAARAGRHATTRTRSCWPGSCRSCPRGAVPDVGRAGAQHPPQLPALVRRRPPVPPGLRARGEADRRHLPLRDRRPRRRSDRRAGRHPGRPRRHRRGHGAAGPRHRAPGAQPAACAGTWRTGCWCTATRRWCSAELRPAAVSGRGSGSGGSGAAPSRSARRPPGFPSRHRRSARRTWRGRPGCPEPRARPLPREPRR